MSDDVIVGIDVCARMHVDVDARHITHMAIDPRPGTPHHLGGPVDGLPDAIALCESLTWPADERPPLQPRNERRADLGRDAVYAAARQTNAHAAEPAEAAVVDVLAYIAHYCDRLGLDPAATFDDGLCSYLGDGEDGPAAQPAADAQAPLRAW